MLEILGTFDFNEFIQPNSRILTTSPDSLDTENYHVRISLLFFVFFWVTKVKSGYGIRDTYVYIVQMNLLLRDMQNR